MPELIAIGIVLLINVLAFSFWLGKLSQKVSYLCNDISHIRKDTKEIVEKINEHNQRITKLEGK